MYRERGLTELKEDSALTACRRKPLLENCRHWPLLHLQTILRIDVPVANFVDAVQSSRSIRADQIGRGKIGRFKFRPPTRFSTSSDQQRRQRHKTSRMFFSARAIVSTRPIFSSLLVPEVRQFLLPTITSSYQVRHGSMKFKRIQKKKPKEENRIWKLIRGTKLQPKFKKKKVKIRGNADPNKYLDVKEVESDPWDITGRTTLKVVLIFRHAKLVDSSIYACFTGYATSSTANSRTSMERKTTAKTNDCKTRNGWP